MAKTMRPGLRSDLRLGEKLFCNVGAAAAEKCKSDKQGGLANDQAAKKTTNK